MSPREEHAVGSAVFLRSPKTSWAVAALAIAAMLWNASPVRAGFFTVTLDSPGLFHASALDPANPVALAASGGAAHVSGNAAGFASAGPLGVALELVNTGQQFVDPFVVGGAVAAFDDTFTASLPGQRGKAGTLVFTFRLDGSLNAHGDDEEQGNHSSAGVHATGGVGDQVPSLFFVSSGDRSIDFSQSVFSPDAPTGVSQDFTIRLPVLLGLDNEVRIAMNLQVAGEAIPAGTVSFATADLMHTFSITSVQLFDDQRQSLENASMTDSAGNKLQVGSPAAVPEPSALPLLGIGALGLLGYAWCRRKGAA